MSRTTCRNGFIFVAAMCLGLMVTSVRGGSLDDTGAPTDPASAMYTAKDLYNRLAFGTNAPKRAGAFTEPTAGPTAGTMPTMDEIMAQAPATNTNAATSGDVQNGKAYWGLGSGAWGTNTGTRAYAPVPKTGQTTSYTPYDDGWNSTNKGVAWPNPRFTVGTSGDATNCVTDNLTGLIWARDASNACGAASAQTNWGTAVTNCNNLNYGGQTDWRLPNVRELHSLIDFQYYGPALSDGIGTNQWTEALGPFTGVQSNFYWSSSTHSAGTDSAWRVSPYYGYASIILKTTMYYVWPVRGP